MNGRRLSVIVTGRSYGTLRPTAFAAALTAAGHAVTILDPDTGRRSPGTRRIDKLLARIGGAWAILRTGAKVISRSFSADVVCVMPMNRDFFFIGWLATRLSRRPLMTDFFVSYFDTGLDAGWYDVIPSRASFDRAVDRFMIEHSDVLIHLSRHELNHVREIVGASAVRAERIVPLGVPSRALSAPPSAPPLNVCWWGNLTRLHGIDRVVTAFEILQHRSVPARLHLFVLKSGGASAALRGDIERRGLTGVVTLHEGVTFATGELETRLTRDCHLALGIFGDSAKAQNTVATKVVEALSMALPVLTMKSEALGEFMDPSADLFTCENSPEEIAASIERVMNDPGERRRRAENGYRVYRERFTEELFGRAVVTIVEETARGTRITGPRRGRNP